MTEKKLLKKRQKRKATSACAECGTAPQKSLARFLRRHPERCRAFFSGSVGT